MEKLKSNTKHAILMVEASKIDSVAKDGPVAKALKEVTELEFKTNVFKQESFDEVRKEAAELNKLSVKEPEKYQEYLKAFQKDLTESVKLYSSPKTLAPDSFKKVVNYIGNRANQKDVKASVNTVESMVTISQYASKIFDRGGR
ncbi:MAG: hypothetical protein BWY78_01435 [Alphaproteobacteria bacterium ADurb.Bin438]|nr:MAG: hypothetical protein BWY78_01435 [Alphaproteobacteria bacterium ADurb.Bin438]